MIFGRIGVNTQIHMDLCRGVTHQDNPEDRRTVTKPWSIVGVSLPGGRVTRCMTMDYNSRWDMVNTESEERASERALWQLWVLAAGARPAVCRWSVGPMSPSSTCTHRPCCTLHACWELRSVSHSFWRCNTMQLIRTQTTRRGSVMLPRNTDIDTSSLNSSTDTTFPVYHFICRLFNDNLLPTSCLKKGTAELYQERCQILTD